MTITAQTKTVTREEPASLFMETSGNHAKIFAEVYTTEIAGLRAKVATTYKHHDLAPAVQVFNAAGACEAADFFRKLAGILGAPGEATETTEAEPFDVTRMKDLIGKESGLIRVANADESDDPVCLSLMSDCWWLTQAELDESIVFLQRLRATCRVLTGR